MQRWFYANEELICDKVKTQASSETEFESLNESLGEVIERTWRFCVTVLDRELLPNEAIALTGDCEELGNWEFDCCVLMTPIHENKPDMWHVFVDIPAEKVITYRYLIVAIDPDKDELIVRFFESHLKPRKIPPRSVAVVDVCDDVFGWIEEIYKVERGWLTRERIMQFMFFKAPFKWEQKELSECTFHVKVTPYFRKSTDKCDRGHIKEDISMLVESFYDENEKETTEKDKADITEKKKFEQPWICGDPIPSFSKMDFSNCEQFNISDSRTFMSSMKKVESTEENTEATQDKTKQSTAFAFHESTNLNEYKPVIQRQPRFGTPCGKDDQVMVHLTIGDFPNTVYLVEIYLYNKNINKDEYPHLFGYRYIEPEDFEIFSQGFLEAPIICASKHRPLGTMRIRFLIIRPHETLKFNLSTSYLRHWNRKHDLIAVGHRGQGKSYDIGNNNIMYENTIFSMNEAVQNGADMIEFDVHLTKDFVPIVYHDFNVHVSKEDPTILQAFDNTDVPLCKYNYNELRNLKMTSYNYNAEPNLTRISDAMASQQLFPRLSDVLDGVPEKIAFDIEIKWPQQYTNCQWEEDFHPWIDPNVYVDRILEMVVPTAQKRRIVFSSFDADICLLLRFKQNHYPVMFLVRDEREIEYLDPRTKPLTIGVSFAHSMELLGVIPYAETLLKNPSFIGKTCGRDLVVFSYGIEDHKDIRELNKAGVSAVIFDRMDNFAQIRREVTENQGGGDE